ncbi:DUF4148 domain-containing protein [Paraburkholderia susongensis]|uniref:DUF4148 domain-containing protein n=1 Tax=Paraburkholderia susongensis TaxID=1515439 RepID=A0A1X7J7W7_9BURK|nr:DUF4148 domain-containing protein [Paraburkholderia susongensis]SMG23084.1 protein of unknown function [Paraburkholderia susongensis]
MKRNLLAAAALLTLAIGLPAGAYAQTTSSDGVTRAQVRAELIQAQRDGTVPAPDWDYPPSARTIARNRELYAITHGEEHATASNTSAPASMQASTASAQ